MSLFDINEPALLGIAVALKNAAGIWESLGAPAPTDAQRESIRANLASEKLDPNFARETYRVITYWAEAAQMDAARAERDQAWARKREQRDVKRRALVAEMQTIRESIGLSQSEMNTKLNLPPGVVNNSENPRGSYAIDRLEGLARRYRVEAKLAGISGAQAPKKQPRAQATA